MLHLLMIFASCALWLIAFEWLTRGLASLIIRVVLVRLTRKLNAIR